MTLQAIEMNDRLGSESIADKAERPKRFLLFGQVLAPKIGLAGL